MAQAAQYAQQMAMYQAQQQQQMLLLQQQQAQAQQQQQPAAAQQPQYAQQQQAQAQNLDVTLVVGGCAHATVGAIVRGSFQLIAENHGKPVYKKDGQVNGLDVMTYFWDERDGAGFCGWWFGPKVGGDQVWAYHSERAAMPPQNGWKVPYDGAVDNTMVIERRPKGSVAAQQPQQQAYGQQAQQQAYGQQAQQQMQQQQMTQQQMLQQQQQKMQEQQALQAQRYQLEQMKAKQQQDNGQRAEQMRQQQIMQQQQKLAQNKQMLEEANQKRAVEQQQKMIEMKAQHQLLIAQREEEKKKKEAEIEMRKHEQIAVLGIRRAMQAYTKAFPDKVDEYKKALDEVMATELDKCGTQKERMATEIEAAVVATKDRIEKMAEAKKKAEEQREAENVRRRELKVKAEALLAELEKLVAKAEQANKDVGEELQPLIGDKEMKVNEVEACCSAVETAVKECNAASQECSEFVIKNGAEIKNTPAVLGETAPTCATDLQTMLTRISEVKKQVQAAQAKSNAQKVHRIKKAEAKTKQEAAFVSFKKFDADKDGKLSRREIQAFAKGEYKFSLPVESLDLICAHLIAEGAKGVEKDMFHRMKTMIGVAREGALDVKRKEAREAKEAALAKLKEKLTQKIAKAGEKVTAASEATAKAAKDVSGSGAKAKDLTGQQMVELANELDSAVEEATSGVKSGREAIAALSAEVEPELKTFLTAETIKLEYSLKTMEGNNTKAKASLTSFRVGAVKKNNAELAKLRIDGLAMISFHQGAKKLERAALYDLFDKKKAGKVDESSFVKFFKTCEKEESKTMSEDDASRLFNYLDADDQGGITQEVFMNMLRKFMKVVKASVITEDISTKSGVVRRLEEGEVLEVLMGPTQEDGADIARLKVKAMSDDKEGWVTPLGNQGSVFLEEGGSLFKVVKETILTGSFVIGEDKTTKDRKLKVGEVLEVREWARKEEVSGVMRMKVVVKTDGQIGWATQEGNTGIKFLECM